MLVMKTSYLKYIAALALFGTNGIVASLITLSSYEIVYLRTFIGSLLPVLAETSDPQQADLILDRAYYEEMGQLAKETGSQYMQGYVSLMVDIANLRAAVRTARMGKENEFLAKVLLDGGSISAKSLLSAKNGAVAELCKSGALRQVGELANQAASGSASLTAFEKACDDALMAYIATARKIPFGEEVLIGYLCAREAELTAARTILSGRLAGLDGDTIRARLRATYV